MTTVAHRATRHHDLFHHIARVVERNPATALWTALVGLTCAATVVVSAL